MPILLEEDLQRPLPRMYRVRQQFDETRLEDVAGTVRAELAKPEIRALVKPGMRIAVGVGSRGIQNLYTIVETTVNSLKELGAEPFIVSAMGSHGGATAEGQFQILKDYGVTEEAMGCPVKSSMETVQIGISGMRHQPVFMDKNASEADGIILFNRIKPHTSFRGPYESGLMKMMAIGLGKQKGAESIHHQSPAIMHELVEEYGRTILENAPVLGGIAIIENAYDDTYLIKGLSPEEIISEEPKLKEISYKTIAHLLFDKCDVLVVDKIGKNISGDGMDPNITGNFPTPYASGGLKSQRVGVLNLSPESHGNAIGAGNCSVMTQRIFDQIDLSAMYMNCITCTIVSSSRIPVIMESDKECVQMCLRTCVNNDKQNPKVVRIPNSLHIEHVLLSEAYWEQAQADPNLEIESLPEDWPFDENGDLPMENGTIVF